MNKYILSIKLILILCLFVTVKKYYLQSSNTLNNPLFSNKVGAILFTSKGGIFDNVQMCHRTFLKTQWRKTALQD